MWTFSECKSCGAKNRLDMERAKQSIVRCGSCGFAINHNILPSYNARPGNRTYPQANAHSTTSRASNADPPTAQATSAPPHRGQTHPPSCATADTLKGIRNAHPSTRQVGRQECGQRKGERPVFVALDFETADNGRDSACALATVRVEGGSLVEKGFWYVRPPRCTFTNSRIHGITWQQVCNHPPFAQVWLEVLPMLAGADFLAAHNAPFDRSVLKACCLAAGLQVPNIPFRCTVQLARQTWGLNPTRLPDVCRFLGLPLNHHEPASDAEACARIVLAATSLGRR